MGAAPQDDTIRVAPWNNGFDGGRVGALDADQNHGHRLPLAGVQGTRVPVTHYLSLTTAYLATSTQELAI